MCGIPDAEKGDGWMAQHRTFREEFGCSAEEAAVRIGDLRYDELEEFFCHLARKLAADSEADRAIGRTRLHQRLWALAWQLELVEDMLRSIWNLCKPYMKEQS